MLAVQPKLPTCLSDSQRLLQGCEQDITGGGAHRQRHQYRAAASPCGPFADWTARLAAHADPYGALHLHDAHCPHDVDSTAHCAHPVQAICTAAWRFDGHIPVQGR